MIKKFLLPAIVVLVALFGAITLVATAPELEPSSAEPVPMGVRSLVAAPRPVRLTVSSQGTVVPSTETDLIPEVAGRVVEVSASLVTGGYFAKGDVLLRLEDADYQSAAAQASASVAQAEAEYEHARYEYVRHSELESRRLTSRSSMENALRTQRVAEAALRKSRVALEDAERDLARTRIVAPFDGVVRSESVDLGQYVQPGTVVARIYATDYVEVRLPIADRQLAYLALPLSLRRGQLPPDSPLGVTLFADFAGQTHEWPGAIVRTEAEIDQKSRLLHVIARVKNDPQRTPLQVGLFVEAVIEGVEVDDVVTLPRNALRDGNRVLLIDAENRLRYRDVEVLRLYRDEVLIRGGLAHGDNVCISVVQTAFEGMLVAPVQDTPTIGGL